MNIRLLISTVLTAAMFAAALPAAAQGSGETIVPSLAQAIPNMPGKSLIAVTLDYAPGGASPAYEHAKSASIFAYVVSGDIETQIDDAPIRIYHAGESFFEPPGSIHRISRNASKSRSAKLLAVIVVDTDDKPYTAPLK
ncbi:cupin domain-containing protein [Paraburkholderia sp. ZP32-5]|uniref:cupin domain-containing protein n=1 Tax=Paraburkholderia sp. ZP32-5 TaxID=2883245 RepID=UPI001F1BADA3|nr:cupin domain-containing protein [Paraburkholderia sp. ZP32-5]